LPLAILVLRQTRVTSAGLGALHDLPLRHVDLSHTAVTDGGLAHLAGLHELRTIDLSGTSISDQSVSDLLEISSLKTVFVAGTRITAAGLARLKAARPEIQVYADQPVR